MTKKACLEQVFFRPQEYLLPNGIDHMYYRQVILTLRSDSTAATPLFKSTEPSQIDPGNGKARVINFDLHASSGTGYCGRTRRLEAERTSADQEYRISHASKADRRTSRSLPERSSKKGIYRLLGVSVTRFELAPRASAMRGAGPHAPCPPNWANELQRACCRDL